MHTQEVPVDAINRIWSYFSLHRCIKSIRKIRMYVIYPITYKSASAIVSGVSRFYLACYPQKSATLENFWILHFEKAELFTTKNFPVSFAFCDWDGTNDSQIIGRIYFTIGSCFIAYETYTSKLCQWNKQFLPSLTYQTFLQSICKWFNIQDGQLVR